MRNYKYLVDLTVAGVAGLRVEGRKIVLVTVVALERSTGSRTRVSFQ
jgi:hypothetical protein